MLPGASSWISGAPAAPPPRGVPPRAVDRYRSRRPRRRPWPRRRLGDDAGDGVADEAHLVGRQRRARRLPHRRAVPILERHDAFERAVFGEVGAGIDAKHARHRARGRGVDALDHAMRDAAAHHHRIGLAGELDVVGVAALAAHQRGVLGAGHRLADAELHQGETVWVVVHIHNKAWINDIACKPGGRRRRFHRLASAGVNRLGRMARSWPQIEEAAADKDIGHAMPSARICCARVRVLHSLRCGLETAAAVEPEGFGAEGRNLMKDEGRATGGLGPSMTGAAATVREGSPVTLRLSA